MFTGLITHRAKVTSLEKLSDGGLSLSLSNPFSDSEPICDGESIAINGCCLTALLPDKSELAKPSTELLFFVSAETLSLTTLERLQLGAVVNLERALRLGDRFGGHVVSGHVDCMGRIVAVQPESGSTCVTVSYPAAYGALVIVKGSIALDGVSLTINTVLDNRVAGICGTASCETRSFTINIIPHTNEQTGFAALSVGAEVNLEFDMFAKFALRSAQLRHNEENEMDSELTKTLADSLPKGAFQ